MISIHLYQSRVVRDLAWACFSAPLLHSPTLAGPLETVSNCALGPTPARCAWLQRLDHDPAPLVSHLARLRSTRLGLYFEHLWHFFLTEDPLVDLVAHNLPVRDGGTTVGEFDCLYYCHTRLRHVHLELAVKYYLGYRHAPAGDDQGASCEWLGPDPRDSLERKVTHMMQRQITLGSHPAAADPLRQLGIADPVREVEIKGYLFQPRSQHLPPPQGFNQERDFGCWLSMETLGTYLAGLPERRFLVLPRLAWLAPALAPRDRCDSRSTLLARLRRHFSLHRQPQLVAALDTAGRESLRFFVTDGRWPGSGPR